MPSTRSVPVEEPVDVQRLYAAHTAATAWFRAQLHRNYGPMVYLRGRGLDAVVDHDVPWGIGFAPHTWTGLVDHLRRRGFTDAELLHGGLAFPGRDGRLLDRFRDRIMFPLRDEHGRVVGYTGRTWHPPSAHDRHQAPKYLNSPGTSIYHKGEVLFGLHEQRDRTDAGYPPVVVEGPTDALAIWTTYSRTGRTGFAGLATCGTALTAAQLELAAGLPGARRYGLGVAFDSDQAGRKATERTHLLLTQRHPGLVARSVRLTAGSDPADLVRTPDGPARLRAALHQAQPLLHQIIDDRIDRLLSRTPRLLHEVEGRLQLAYAVLPLIAEQPATTITNAIAHVATTVLTRSSNVMEATTVVSETVQCLTSVVAHYLETTPPAVPAPPAPQSGAAAFPSRLSVSEGAANAPVNRPGTSHQADIVIAAGHGNPGIRTRAKHF